MYPLSPTLYPLSLAPLIAAMSRADLNWMTGNGAEEGGSVSKRGQWGAEGLYSFRCLLESFDYQPRIPFETKHNTRGGEGCAHSYARLYAYDGRGTKGIPFPCTPDPSPPSSHPGRWCVAATIGFHTKMKRHRRRCGVSEGGYILYLLGKMPHANSDCFVPQKWVLSYKD